MSASGAEGKRGSFIQERPQATDIGRVRPKGLPNKEGEPVSLQLVGHGATLNTPNNPNIRPILFFIYFYCLAL